MTYAGILSLFIVPACLVIVALVVRDSRLSNKSDLKAGVLAVLFHMLLALIYTTPWDNYLVANRVWWYDPALVTGITLAWVPLEEYAFFMLQTAFTGFWYLWIRQRFPERDFTPDRKLRKNLSLLGLALWSLSIMFALFSSPKFTYLTLITIWAIPPMVLQVAFGGDILAANWRAVILGIIPPTIYLWTVDLLAIQWGTWTISPSLTTGIKLAILPLEEMLFFLVTNIMVVFGITLLLSPQSRQRARAWLVRLGFRRLATREATQ